MGGRNRPETEKTYYINNRERIIKKQKEYQSKNKEKIKKRFKAWYELNKEKESKRRKEKYKIFGLRTRELLAGRPRPNKCEICDREGYIVFEHCHKTNKFRGWSCSRCNTALGMVQDSVEILEKLIKYLKDNK